MTSLDGSCADDFFFPSIEVWVELEVEVALGMFLNWSAANCASPSLRTFICVSLSSVPFRAYVESSACSSSPLSLSAFVFCLLFFSFFSFFLLSVVVAMALVLLLAPSSPATFHQLHRIALLCDCASTYNLQ
jgi:hypothetical protein